MAASLRSRARNDSTCDDRKRGTLVIGVVILRHNGAADALHAAVASLLHDSHAGLEGDHQRVRDVVLVDNASTNDPAATDRVAASFGLPVRSLHLDRNYGFSAGVNKGIAELNPACDTVLLLNDDAILEPGALRSLADALHAAPSTVISAAPKIMLAEHPGIIDAVGIAVGRNGEANNIGIGQPDLGQFDTPQTVLGPCFAVALIRRSAFDHNRVGPLPERYFLYYEDVAWNWRAHLLGFDAITCPLAIATHHMSASSRSSAAANEASYGFKHRYIERNLMVTGTELLATRDAVSLWINRMPGLVKSGLIGRFPKPSRWAVQHTVTALPNSLVERRRVSQRTVPGRRESATAFSATGEVFFDPVQYEPKRSWETLQLVASRAGYHDLAIAAGRRADEPARLAISEITNEAHRHTATDYLAHLTSRRHA
jgi:GT2 family glycosyltransferase